MKLQAERATPVGSCCCKAFWRDEENDGQNRNTYLLDSVEASDGAVIVGPDRDIQESVVPK